MSLNRKILISFMLTALGATALFIFAKGTQGVTLSPYPDGKNFAFTITDDPDYGKLEKMKPIYELLSEKGLKTTVGVWVKEAFFSNGLPEQGGKFNYGDTCVKEDYLNYVKSLKERGFELSLHTVSGGNDYRRDTIEGYEEFKRLFGDYPKINVMHSDNLENVYWGKNIFKNGIMRKMMELLSRKGRMPFSGEDEKSPYFWGDICRDKTKYVRLWGTSDINTLKFNPSMPYHDPAKPYVNYWFSFSDGYNAKFFVKLLAKKNVKKLVKERGTCIAYTHFSHGFCDKQSDTTYKVKEGFKNLIDFLSQQKDGWFVPASQILDRLLDMKKVRVFQNRGIIIVSNYNALPVEGITLLTRPLRQLYRSDGRIFKANEEGEIVIGTLGAGESLSLFNSERNLSHYKNKPAFLENIRLIIERTRILLFSHGRT